MNVVEVRGLTRTYGARKALDNVSLTVPKGQVLGLIGENGAGKTTLIKHILGLLKAQQGTVQVLGMDPVEKPAEVLASIGYLAEEDFLPGWMKVFELQRYYQGFYKNWDQAYAEDLRNRFGIDRKAFIRQLSKGQRARVGLMAALAYRPDLLLLDEPSSGLDPIVRRDILGSIIRAVAEDQRTVLFSSHLLSEIEQVADQVAMIRNGKILFQNGLEEIKGAHIQVTLRFERSRESGLDLEEAFRWRGAGQEWICLYSGALPTLEAAASLAGGKIVDRNWLSLDEIFVARSMTEESCPR